MDGRIHAVRLALLLTWCGLDRATERVSESWLHVTCSDCLALRPGLEKI